MSTIRDISRQSQTVPQEYPDEKDHRRQIVRALNPLIASAALHPTDIPTTISSTYTMVDSDRMILAKADAAALTVFLLPAAGREGRAVTVKKIDSTNNIVTIDPNSAETIDAQATRKLNCPHEGAVLVSDGTNWRLDLSRAVTLGTDDLEAIRAETVSGQAVVLVNTKSALNSAIFQVESTAVDAIACQLNNSNAAVTTGKLLNMNFSGDTPDDNSAKFLEGADATATRIIIYSDGDLQNHDNSYGAISDERLKQDVTTASSQWNDIKAIPIKNFRFKSDVDQGKDKTLLGCLAQEVEAISPGLVTTNLDEKTGEVVKGIKYSILYMKAVGALQEAMARIEALEAKVKA